MITVLILDDEFFFRQAVRKYLSEYKGTYEVVGEAKNGREGIELVKTLRPEVVLIDINMPIMDGMEVAEELSKNHFQGKMIMVTGYGEFEYAQKSIKFGVWDYLLKPIRKQQLVESIRRAADQIYEEREQNARYKELKSREYTSKKILEEYLIDKIVNSGGTEDIRITGKLPGVSNRKSYLTVLIDIYYDDTDYWQENDAPICNFEIINVLKEILMEKKIYCFTRIDKDRSICVILNSDLTTAELEQRAGSALEDFYYIAQHRLFLSVLISAGTAKESLMDSAESYKEALSVKRFWFLYHEKGIHYKAQQETLGNRGEASLGQRAVRLLFFMKTNNVEEVRILLDHVFDEMKEGEVIPEIVFWRANTIISCAYEFAQDIQADLVKEEGILALLPTDLTKRTIDEIHSKILTYVLGIMKMVHRIMDESWPLLPEKVVRYIDGHYMRPDFSLENLTKEFGISKTTLCRQFKDVIKMTVGEYLWQTRMLSAKELLDDGYCNIAYVAEKCGYEDAGYFSKQFRKYFGISPTDYIRMKVREK